MRNVCPQAAMAGDPNAVPRWRLRQRVGRQQIRPGEWNSEGRRFYVIFDGEIRAAAGWDRKVGLQISTPVGLAGGIIDLHHRAQIFDQNPDSLNGARVGYQGRDYLSIFKQAGLAIEVRLVQVEGWEGGRSP